MLRSYAIHRPIGPFTWPSEHRDKAIDLVNYDHLTFVPEIGRNAFGYIDWEDSVPMEDLRRYELVVPERSDAKLEMVGRTLADFAAKELWERFEAAWGKARDEFGYTDDQIERAFGRHGRA